MLLLLLLGLALAPILPGLCLAEMFVRTKQKKIQEIYIGGWLLCMLAAGGANGLTVLTHHDLGWCVKVFVVLMSVLEIVTGLIWSVLLLWHKQSEKKRISVADTTAERKREGSLSVRRGLPDLNKPESWIFLAFLFLVVMQIAGIWSRGYVYRTGDMTLETVQSFLDTGMLYEQNPLTGRPYEGGVPLRIRILCLPGLYAVLCSIFQLPAEQVVWVVMPIYHLLCGYAVYSLVAGSLFRGKRLQRNSFLLVAALLFSFGAYAFGTDGMGMLYQGFKGESIRAVILLPLTLCAVGERKWILWLLCIAAEACLVWTLYGMGACLWVGIGLMLATACVRYFSGKKGEVSL